MGAPSPTPKGWKIATIQHILHRTAYLRQVEQFKQRKGKFFTVSGGRVMPVRSDDPVVKPKADWMAVKCPRIIDQELWDEAQAKLRKRQKATGPHPTYRRPFLAGLLYCGHCGQRMYAADVKRKQGKSHVIDRVYVCSSYNANGKHKCFRNVIHEKPVLDYLIGQICNRLLAPENFERLRAEVRRQLKTRNKAEGIGDLKSLRARIAKTDEEIKAAVKELRRTPDDLYELAVDELRDLRTSRDKLGKQLASLESRQKSQLGDIDSEVGRALAAIDTLKERITDADPSVVREALSRTCERIDLWFEHQHFKKQTRSFFKKGLIRFHNVADSLRLTIPPN